MITLYKRFALLLIALLCQSCCLFGTTDVEKNIWVATNNPRPTLSSEIQLESCIAEDKKQCSDSFALACRDLISGKNAVKFLNRATGEPVSANSLSGYRDQCLLLKDDPKHITELCQYPSDIDSCMIKNGYQEKKIGVTECSSMKMM